MLRNLLSRVFNFRISTDFLEVISVSSALGKEVGFNQTTSKASFPLLWGLKCSSLHMKVSVL